MSLISHFLLLRKVCLFLFASTFPPEVFGTGRAIGTSSLLKKRDDYPWQRSLHRRLRAIYVMDANADMITADQGANKEKSKATFPSSFTSDERRARKKNQFSNVFPCLWWEDQEELRKEDIDRTEDNSRLPRISLGILSQSMEFTKGEQRMAWRGENACLDFF